MEVHPTSAREKGLESGYRDTDYYFCGKGCKLDFDENPVHYLDPTYEASM